MRPSWVRSASIRCFFWPLHEQPVFRRWPGRLIRPLLTMAVFMVIFGTGPGSPRAEPLTN